MSKRALYQMRMQQPGGPIRPASFAHWRAFQRVRFRMVCWWRADRVRAVQRLLMWG